MRRFRSLRGLLLIAALTAATPTANKQYEKPTPQGDPNVWGQFLNGNFDAIDANLAGIATVAMASPQTTATPAQAQNLVQKLVGTLTANTTFLLPASQSLYIIDNETTGAFALTVQTVAPGSQGTQVSQGARNILFSDGTNIFQAGPTGLPPTGAAGGDLTGNFPNPSVVTGAGANQIVRLNGTAQLPAVDGSQLNFIYPSGAVMYFAGSSPPAPWLIGNGQALSRTAFATLFSVIGTTYGVGDGVTTFNVPDCRGTFIAGLDPGNATGRLTQQTAQGVSAAALGNRGGEQAHVQTVAELVGHTHSVSVTDTSAAVVPGGANNVFAGPGTSGTITTLTATGTAFTQGGSAAANVVPPALVMNCIIHP